MANKNQEWNQEKKNWHVIVVPLICSVDLALCSIAINFCWGRVQLCLGTECAGYTHDSDLMVLPSINMFNYLNSEPIPSILALVMNRNRQQFFTIRRAVQGWATSIIWLTSSNGNTNTVLTLLFSLNLEGAENKLVSTWYKENNSV